MNTREIILGVGFLCIATMLFLIHLNNTNIKLRYLELGIKLQGMDQVEGNIDHITLIATFNLHKRLYERQISQDMADAAEQMIQSLLLNRKSSGTDEGPDMNFFTLSSIQLINFNRRILGKPTLRVKAENNEDMTDIDIAYYYERNFLFAKAASYYEKAMQENRYDSAIMASILLHQGYCYALTDKIEKANEKFHTVIESYNLENSAITATILLKYLDGFISEQKRVQESSADPLVKSESLVNLLAYKKALNTLEKIEHTAKPAHLLRIRYYKARCFTGLGEKERAVETYLRIITSSPSSHYARLSNRKLYMIGTRSGGDNPALRVALKINEHLLDPVLTGMIENQRNFPASGQAIPDIEPVKIPDRLLKKIDRIGEPDDELLLSGRYIVINTSDGNLFKGNLIEMTDSLISLQTSIGRIDVKRDRITSISRAKK